MIRYASILLVGGKSQRMGEDKAHLRFGDQSFAARIADVLRSATEYVVVVRAPGQDLPEDLHADQIIEDPIPGEGPLVGLVAGLSALDGIAEMAFAASVDAPLLRSEMVHGLLETLGADSTQTVVAARTSDQTHPLCAAYRVSIARAAMELLESGQRRLSDLLDRQKARYVDDDSLQAWDPKLESLININTPGELRDVRGPKP